MITSVMPEGTDIVAVQTRTMYALLPARQQWHAEFLLDLVVVVPNILFIGIWIFHAPDAGGSRGAMGFVNLGQIIN